jgi:hypothetical protein
MYATAYEAPRPTATAFANPPAPPASSRREEYIDLSLRGLSVLVETYPETTVHSMRLALLISDVEIVDKVLVGARIYI